jgi:hypothetical protein
VVVSTLCRSASKLVVARAIHRLVSDKPHDIAAFVAWVPDLNVQILPVPELPMLASTLGKEGVALGVPVHHTVVNAMWRFMVVWADDEFAR